jgi:hypothetical protein
MNRAFLLLPLGLLLSIACTSEDPPVSRPAKDCAKYCSSIQTNCADADNNGQYPITDNNTTCLTMCGAMKAGTETDLMVDSLACRIGQITNAVEAQTPEAKRRVCFDAGPFSKACNATNDRCETFCSLNLALCQGNNSPYDGNLATCMSACKMFRTDEFENKDNKEKLVVAPNRNSLFCRSYHLEAASANAASRAVHCSHTGVISPVCKDSMVVDGGAPDAATLDATAPKDAAADAR